ncbi:RHS repeat-associated core domain-containing protein [Pseudomonas kurunegalensis]|uniref:RHS repeat-associated core domain-containing protein n=1 Tax=Pseudomonas kurunegalensis TaxID=485880 RepID=UPI00256FAD56|nr:RHS repeat-associated core domain-containing protein [Pseudomonas kurunegalensis]WJD64931.1 RHS repeat-associated core domain-containing protein [Pseudomonas kurunegalensis]
MSNSKNTTRFFLQRDRVHTALTGNAAVICMRAQSGVLAETRLAEETTRSALLAADSGDSVLRVKSQALPESVAYSAYGLHSPNDIPAQRPAFNGHLLVSDLYLLGNGYRGYNPVLMRFHSPDSLSPFAAGGLNCYAYCAGDPINFGDPSGHMLKRNISPINSPVTRRREVSPMRVSSKSHKELWDLIDSQGWNIESAAPPQTPQYAELSSLQNIAEASQVAARSSQIIANAHLSKTPSLAPSQNGSSGLRDSYVGFRKAIKPSEIKRLHEWNTVDYRPKNEWTLEQGQLVNKTIINAMGSGDNPMEKVRGLYICVTNAEILSAVNSVRFQLRKMRSGN